MFLTQEELATLTGYALGAWQRRWLDRHIKLDDAQIAEPLKRVL